MTPAQYRARRIIALVVVTGAALAGAAHSATTGAAIYHSIIAFALSAITADTIIAVAARARSGAVR